MRFPKPRLKSRSEKEAAETKALMEHQVNELLHANAQLAQPPQSSRLEYASQFAKPLGHPSQYWEAVPLSTENLGQTPNYITFAQAESLYGIDKAKLEASSVSSFSLSKGPAPMPSGHSPNNLLSNEEILELSRELFSILCTYTFDLKSLSFNVVNTKHGKGTVSFFQQDPKTDFLYFVAKFQDGACGLLAVSASQVVHYSNAVKKGQEVPQIECGKCQQKFIATSSGTICPICLKEVRESLDKARTVVAALKDFNEESADKILEGYEA